MTRSLFKCLRVAALFAAVAITGSTPVSARPRSAASLAVFYDPALAAQGFPNPLARVRIAGHEAVFIIDSGAGTHILADWYADIAGIPATKTATSVEDGSGKTAPARLAHRLEGRWSNGRRVILNDAMVVAFPPYFKSLHLGGLISPQLLAPPGTAAVLDLRIPSLQFVPFGQALTDLRRSKAPAPAVDMTQACRNAHSKIVNRLYVTPVTVAGITDLMLVDTGATGTTLADKSRIAFAVGTTSERDSPSEGVGGKADGRLVRNVQMLRGGGSVTLNPDIGEVAASCGKKGVLGMDALRSCLLILGTSKMAFSCH